MIGTPGQRSLASSIHCLIQRISPPAKEMDRK
jgi:hypothetical protein